jgi:hypothetical protein
LHYSSGDIAAGLLSGKKCRQSSKGGIPMRLIALAALAGLLVAPAIADPEGQYSGVCESAMRLQLAATCSGCDLPGGNRHLLGFIIRKDVQSAILRCVNRAAMLLWTELPRHTQRNGITFQP